MISLLTYLSFLLIRIWWVFDDNLMRIWCVVISIWGVFDAYLKSIWWGFDEYLVRIWGVFYRYLMSIWCVFNEDFISIWCVFDEYLIRYLMSICWMFDTNFGRNATLPQSQLPQFFEHKAIAFPPASKMKTKSNRD